MLTTHDEKLAKTVEIILRDARIIKEKTSSDIDPDPSNNWEDHREMQRERVRVGFGK